MFERFERPIKIVCLAMAVLLAWQLGSLILRGNPLAHLTIPPLPSLPETTNETAKLAQKETNAAASKPGTNGTNIASGTNGTNVTGGTNALTKSNNSLAAGEAGATNASSGTDHSASRKSGSHQAMPGMMAQMMGGGMPGGPGGGGAKKVDLPPEVQSRVDRIIDSEFFGPVIRPMPMALMGIAEEQAFIQATNGQTGPVKLGGELGGIKLLRIGVNRVLVEADGEKKELMIFGGVGGESLMPDPTNAPSTNAASTNMPSTNGPTRRILASKQKETP
jgi:hypothetical protein